MNNNSDEKNEKNEKNQKKRDKEQLNDASSKIETQNENENIENVDENEKIFKKKKIEKKESPLRSKIPTEPLNSKLEHWKFFRKTDHFHVECPKESGGCGTILAFEDGETTSSNIKKHGCWIKWLKDTKQKDNSKITDFFSPIIDSKLKEKIDILLAKFIVCDDRPFAIIETPSFKNFTNALNPAYKPPSYKTLMRILKQQHDIANKNLIAELEDVHNFSLNFDLWSSICDDHYLSLNCNFLKIDKLDVNKIEMKKRSLAMINLEEIHCTGDVIKIVIENKLKQLNILKENVVGVTTDGGANVMKAVDLLEIKHVYCAGHILNLIVQEGLEQISELRSKSRNICSFFHRSLVGWSTLKKYQEDLKLFSNSVYKIINEVSTRFNSSLDMFERLSLIEISIDKALTELKQDALILSYDEKKNGE